MVANSDSLNFNDPQNVATVVQNRVIVSTNEVPNPTVRTTANKVNVLLSQALPGASLRTGSGDPVSTVGVVGDLYINTINNTVWGPKTTAGWPGAPFATMDSGDAGDGANVIVSEDAPSEVEHGDLWYESDTGRTFIYYTDEDTSQWVEIGIAGSDMVISDAGAPLDSIGLDGQFYYDTLNDVLYGPKGVTSPGVWDTETVAYGGGIFTGTGAPTETLGTGGSYYWNTETNQLFGPKTFAGWPTEPLVDWDAPDASSGYEFTGGFTDRTTGTAGASDVGSNVQYTTAMVTANRWLRLGFDSTAQTTNDFAYWTDPTPSPTAGVGLFGGDYMPGNVTSLFDFDFNEDPGYSAAVEAGDFQYTAATGSYDFSQLKAGDLALIRFDFNLLPQIANTTVEVALIWQTRDSDGNPTFTFALTGPTTFFGTGTVGKTFLQRPLLSAYFASNEDVAAKAVPAIRADNPVQIQPLTTLCTIVR
jgi:hypothetical protein